jgi:hypothetical protein
MSAPQHHEIRRRPDGSIDLAHYEARAARLRGAAIIRMAAQLRGWLAAAIRRVAAGLSAAKS